LWPSSQNNDWWAVEDFILQLPANAHATCWGGFTIEDDEVDVASVHCPNDNGLSGAFNEIQSGQLRRWAGTKRSQDSGTSGGVIAVHKNVD
jgi:hypothetical protein